MQKLKSANRFQIPTQAFWIQFVFWENYKHFEYTSCSGKINWANFNKMSVYQNYKLGL